MNLKARALPLSSRTLFVGMANAQEPGKLAPLPDKLPIMNHLNHNMLPMHQMMQLQR